VRRVTEPPAQQWAERRSWSELAADPIAVVASSYEGEADELPTGVYENARWYPLERFQLSGQAQDDLAKLCRLRDCEPERMRVIFGTEEIAAAEALGVCHRSTDGHCVLIDGGDVAEQLAGDYLARQLKEARAERRRARDWERQRAKADGSAGRDGGKALSDDELKQQRRRQREQERERRRQAAAHNAELGVCVVKAFAKLKLDERAVKILATLNLGSELDQLAMRGARYGFPGWVEQSQTQRGKPRTVYIDRRQAAGAKAREYLSVAKTAQELAGRLLALVAMARYADERAVAESAQSFYRLPVPRELPWSPEIVDLIDELAAERLPDRLTAAKRAERATQREQEAERELLRRSIAERVANADELDIDERSQLRDEIERAYRPYSSEAHELCERLDELDDGAREAEHGDGECSPDGEEAGEPNTL
jgi:hypothetical protein